MHAVLEARRAAPAILHLPHLQLWWETAPPSLRATLWMLLADLPGDLPLLLMASADVPFGELDSVRGPCRNLSETHQGHAAQEVDDPCSRNHVQACHHSRGHLQACRHRGPTVIPSTMP